MTRHPAAYRRGGVGRRLAALGGHPRLWLASFVVPLDIVEPSGAVFTLVAERSLALVLPAPVEMGSDVLRAPTRGLYRHAAALAAGVASAVAVSAGTVAVADTTATPPDPTPSATTTADTGTTTADAGATSTGAVTTASTSTSTSNATTTATTTDTTDATTAPTTDATAATTTSTTSSTPAPATQPAAPDSPSTSTAQSTQDTPSPPPPPATVAPRPTVTAGTPAASSTRPAAILNLTPQRRTTHTDASRHVTKLKPKPNENGQSTPAGTAPRRIPSTLIPPRPRIHARPRLSTTFAAPPQEVSSTTAESLASLPAPWMTQPTLDPFTAAQIAHYETLGASLDQPPAFLIPTYKQAGRRYHIPWQILAAINAIETDYGRNVATSSAGAIGFMQFEPATWMQYGVAADGHSDPNPYNARDAIFSAARYLAANGGAHHLRRAIFAYNHAQWYVDAVLWRAQVITDRTLTFHGHRHGYALPLDARYMATLGRTDEGVDIEDAPDGAAVYSITAGVVTAVASDPSGFGPDYPVVTATSGPLAGQSIYYGHVAASLVHVGDRVLAGEPIAVMGHTGDAASLGHGHIEIGFSDDSGDPLSHGVVTPSGDAMRHVLVGLSALYRVANS